MEYTSGGYFLEDLPKKLDNREIEKYFRLFKNGDKSARKKLIEHNLRLITFIINRQFQSVSNDYSFISFDDLMNVGAIGLIKAVDTFDIEKGIMFSSYAAKCITNEILMLLRSFKNQLCVCSLDEPVETCLDENDLIIADTIDCGIDIIKSYEQTTIDAIINDSLKILTDTERIVVQLRYGFNGVEILTCDQIGKKLRLTQSHISRIDARARKKLKLHFENQDLACSKNHVSEEMQLINNLPPYERAVKCANMIISGETTKAQLAKNLGITVESLNKRFAKTLLIVNPELYRLLNETLEQQESEEIQTNITEISITNIPNIENIYCYMLTNEKTELSVINE